MEVTMIRHTARTALLAALMFLFTGADAEAQWQRLIEPSSQLRFRLGLFEPAGGSDGWNRVFEGFTGTPSDLQDFVWGMDYLWRTGHHTGVLFGFSYYAGSTTSGYQDWVDNDGSEIRHTTRLGMSDLTAAFLYRFGSAAVRPYAGIGGGFIWWQLTDEGQFIDFGAPGEPVFWGWYGADGATFEAFALLGVDIPLSPRWSFVVEGRYRYATDELGNDFSGFGTLDMSGYEITGGFGINF
jgi:hypothetical protein